MLDYVFRAHACSVTVVVRNLQFKRRSHDCSCTDCDGNPPDWICGCERPSERVHELLVQCPVDRGFRGRAPVSERVIEEISERIGGNINDCTALSVVNKPPALVHPGHSHASLNHAASVTSDL